MRFTQQVLGEGVVQFEGGLKVEVDERPQSVAQWRGALLAPDGLFLLHTIGLDDHGSGIDPWVTRYIFPNSEIPTLARLSRAIQGRFKLEDWHNFGTDYARTLCAWHANFSAAWPHFEPRLGARFQRLWRYYLLMFAGVFRGRGLDLWQLVLGGRRRADCYRRPLM